MFAPGRIDTHEVLYARQGGVARILLNRPKAINALTHPMIASMLAQLSDWAADDSVATVCIEGAGDRGLCAGGDVRAIREAILHGGGDPAAFWADEYRLNALIAEYPKPFVTFMDGVTMGGGVGVSAYGTVRLATQRSRIAMPETAIGFFPDVGGRYLLARAPGHIGVHLGMTGLPVDGPGAVLCGLADAVIDFNDIPSIIAGLAEGESASDLTFRKPGRCSLDDDREWIDECYRGADAVAILAALRDHPSPKAAQAAEVIASRSPFSVMVALEGIRRAADESLAEVLASDLHLGRGFLDNPDFVEGVRAVLVDRDNNPQWQHASVAEVDPTTVKQLFD